MMPRLAASEKPGQQSPGELHLTIFDQERLRVQAGAQCPRIHAAEGAALHDVRDPVRLHEGRHDQRLRVGFGAVNRDQCQTILRPSMGIIPSGPF